jgi:hypothetical protein
VIHWLAAAALPGALSLVLPASALPNSSAAESLPQPGEYHIEQPQRGELLRVYLMTMGPGDAVWERFGHNALWIHDPLEGTDLAYNYGLFSFEQPGFIRRFLLGRMLYSMAPGDAHLTVRAYAQYDRSVWVQELNLTPTQKRELNDFLRWNALPENRDYLYDYFRDNCSTRLRDAIDRVTGGALRAALDTVRSSETYRSHSLRLTHDDRPVFTGLLLAMGTPVDAPITAWEESFIPMELSRHVQNVFLPDGAGGRVPLASEPRILFSAARPSPPDAAPDRTTTYLLIGLLIAAFLVTAARLARDQGVKARTSFGVAAVIWTGITGVFGTVIVLLWAVTDHYATAHNANVLLANPLGLVLAVVIPMGLRRGGRWARIALWAAAFSALLAVAAVVVGVLPIHGQRSAEMLGLLVPPQLALAWSLYSMLGVALSPIPDAKKRRRARSAAVRAG